MEKTFLSRIARLILDVRNIGLSGDVSMRIPISGYDEISSLSCNINDMLDKIDQSDQELRKAHDELEMRVKERTEELAGRNIEMERFIYTVSHDLRTPLISVSGLRGFLKQDAEKGDLEQMNADLRIANETVMNMDQLLLETLELSRIGRVVNPPKDVPFGEIVEDALKQTSEKIRSSGCMVSVSENLPVVHVDQMRITEVLVNLIENSLKYMGLQANPEIEIKQRIDGKDRIFFVRDNGIGIDHSQHDKVFELFYNVDKKTEGSGAGLAIVKRIIEVHGGRIWIESEMGQGCTICFTLPLLNVE
ncbi:MAG: ATP-binding protein [Methanotrichaceae archaeon]